MKNQKSKKNEKKSLVLKKKIISNFHNSNHSHADANTTLSSSFI